MDSIQTRRDVIRWNVQTCAGLARCIDVRSLPAAYSSPTGNGDGQKPPKVLVRAALAGSTLRLDEEPLQRHASLNGVLADTCLK
jgi:hypothetical protein